ncbi:C1 family peptidase [Kitasatospora sp. NPDC089797]|uniref:C1 family peptidase n=1 Tax=Kitasatospora sp. NPDC089797 TaxID=3155298 RepID=UPI0034345842
MSTPTRYGQVTVLVLAAAFAAVATVPAAAAATHPTLMEGHAFGALLDPGQMRVHTALPVHPVPKDLPASVDLSGYLPMVGNQGQVGSCMAWALDYNAIGLVEAEQGIKGAPHAPMYTYAQISQGHDGGSTAAQNLAIVTSQGLDTKADYWQGDTDFTTQPDDNERANAANWKLSGYNTLDTGTALVDEVKTALAQGQPVIFGFNVYKSFGQLQDPSLASSYSYYPTPEELAGQPIAGHGGAIVGYNDQGVKIANSWGSNWGDHGYYTVPWKFVTDQMREANAIGGMTATGGGVS